MVLININRKMHQISWKPIWRTFIAQACCVLLSVHFPSNGWESHTTWSDNGEITEPFKEMCALLSRARLSWSMSERGLYLSSNILIKCKLILIIKGILKKTIEGSDNILTVNEENFVHGWVTDKENKLIYISALEGGWIAPKCAR